MVGCYHCLDGHEFEQALGDSEGQGSLAWCKELDTTKETEQQWQYYQLSCSKTRHFCGPAAFPGSMRKQVERYKSGPRSQSLWPRGVLILTVCAHKYHILEPPTEVNQVQGPCQARAGWREEERCMNCRCLCNLTAPSPLHPPLVPPKAGSGSHQKPP